MLARIKYPDELEADFQQYYNLNINCVQNDRVRRLTYQLPAESRIMIKLQPANEWNYDRLLLSKIEYSIERVYYSLFSSKENKLPKPELFMPPEIKELIAKQKAEEKKQILYEIDNINEFLSRPRVQK